MRLPALLSLAIASSPDRRATNSTRSIRIGAGSLWKFRFGGDVVGIATTGDLVFVVSLDNLVRALNRSNGNQVWKRPLRRVRLPRPRCSRASSPSLAPNRWLRSTARPERPIGTFDAPTLLRGQPLVDATPAPFAVSILAITRDGRAIGLKPAEMLFRERAIEPFTALPGRPLQKETSPLP